MRPFKHINISMEAIHFQNGAFFKELTAIYEPYVSGRIRTSDYRDIEKSISACINRHTNANIITVLDYVGACIEIPDADANNILVTKYREFLKYKEFSKLIKNKENIEASVDFENSKLGGVFTEMKPVFHMDITLFARGYMEAEELAAITLHEVGHYFTYCEMMARIESINHILSAMSRQLIDGVDVKERRDLISDAGKALRINEKVVKEVVDNNSDTVVYNIYLTTALRDIKTQNGSSYYDQNTWESMADQFASRHGAGRYLVTALDKIYSYYEYEVRENKFMYYFSNVMSIVTALLSVAGTVLGVVAGAPALLLTSVLFMFVSFINVALLSDNTYDTPKDRAIRVRRDMIQASKSKHMTKSMIEHIVEEVRIIDNVIKNYDDRRDWLDMLGDFLFKNKKAAIDSKEMQKQLESLAMNDLFLQGNRLKFEV